MKKNLYKKYVFGIGLALWAAASIAAGQRVWAQAALSLDDYLKEVRNGNQGYQGAIASGSGGEQRAQEGDLILAPTLFGTAQLSVDKAPKTAPAFQGSETDFNTYSLGISKLYDFGLSTRLYYTLNYTKISGANPALLPLDSYYDGKPTLELSYSLWRNGGGSETKLLVEAANSQALAAQHEGNFRARQYLAQAELAYWRLALARDLLGVTRENLDRAEKMKAYQARRVRLRLADESDLLQAEASLRLRVVELQSAMDEERSAAQAFNSGRGVDSEQVKEPVVSFLTLVSSNSKLPERRAVREDVEAAQYSEKAAVASSRASIERFRPTVEAYSTVSLNGRESTVASTVNNSFGINSPSAAIGVRMNVPLDVSLIKQTQEGYNKGIQAAELNYQRRAFESENEWNDLVRKYREAVKRLDLSRQVEAAQKKKYFYEQDRYSRGKTTAFLVLQFEQDFASAQLQRLRSEGDVMSLVAQLKLFGSSL